MKSSRNSVRVASLALALFMLLALATPALAATVAGYGVITASNAPVYSNTAKTTAYGYFVSGDVVGVISYTGSMYKVQLTGLSVSEGYIDMSAVSGSLTKNIPSGKSLAAVKTGTASSTSSSTSTSSSSSTSTSVSTATSAIVATGIITENGTRIYKELGSSTSSTLNKGNVVEISAQTDTHYQCKYNTTTGYVEKAKVSLLPETVSASGTGTVSQSSTPMYKAASTATSTVTTLSKSVKVTITGEAGTLYQVKYSSYTGYVEKAKITPDAGLSSSAGSSSSSSGSSSGNTLSTVKGNVKVLPGSSQPSSAISTGLAAAKKKNTDTIGYMKIAGTNVEGPILHKSSKEPFYYLTYDISKKKSSVAAINAIYNVPVRNNTITAHNMRGSNRMFHQLHHIQEKALGKSTCAHSKCTSKSLSSVPNMATTASARIWDISIFGYNQWEVWAMYEVPKNEPKSTISTNINSLNNYTTAQVQAWIQKQLDRSQIKFGTSVSPEDLLMTIYTCGDNYDSSTAQSRLYFFLKAVK